MIGPSGEDEMGASCLPAAARVPLFGEEETRVPRQRRLRRGACLCAIAAASCVNRLPE